jgi:cytosine/adenosine deaminase-related metal-dependent hydrolase
MVLTNLRTPLSAEIFSIRIGSKEISEIVRGTTPPVAGNLRIDLGGAIAFPGLINSHDHLDFNLFPRLGNRIYNNYTEWGPDIHKHYKSEIAGTLNIPLVLRAEWGMYKNLLSGVTTVVNHGQKLTIPDPLITIFQECRSLHSVRFEKRWRLKLNDPFRRNLPFAIHVGEGTDRSACSEIDKLVRWNLLKKELVGIHGVAMNKTQARHFKALVWCPDSNYFMLNQTAPAGELKQATAVLFGTDSALTGNWNIWHHLRLARKSGQLTDGELFNSLTRDAADIWKLNTGKIEAGKDADIVIARAENSLAGWQEFYAVNPEDLLLVIHQGKIRLFDEELYCQLSKNKFATEDFSRIYIQGACKYIQGDLPGLIRNIRKFSNSINFPITDKTD